MRKINVGQKVICTWSGVIGKVLKFYCPTACKEQTVVQTEDGREYHAPTDTWIPYVDGVTPKTNIIDEYGLTHTPEIRVDLSSCPDQTGNLLNPYGEFVMQFAKNHNISISEAYEHPICKARLKYFNETGE
jgi:hypothetical protein